jgi:hypothetical protein
LGCLSFYKGKFYICIQIFRHILERKLELLDASYFLHSQLDNLTVAGFVEKLTHASDAGVVKVSEQKDIKSGNTS